MTQSRDFLQWQPPVGADKGPSPVELAVLAQQQQSQYDVLLDIRALLRKQTPDVLAKTIVSNAGVSQTEITDTLQHEVFFEVGGKSVEICKIKIWSTYDQTVYYSFQQMANPLDGIPFAAGDTIFDDSEVRTVYIWAPALSANSLPINGNATTAHGGFNLYGWTIPDDRSSKY